MFNHVSTTMIGRTYKLREPKFLSPPTEVFFKITSELPLNMIGVRRFILTYSPPESGSRWSRGWSHPTFERTEYELQDKYERVT